MVTIRNLEFVYPEGSFRLTIPELAIASGERVAFIGPSGSGKTTLLHLIAGIRLPAAGSVETLGTAVSSLAAADRRTLRIRKIGLVFQEFELLDYLSVLDNVLLPYRLHGALRLNDGVRDRARELLTHIGLGDKLGRYPDHLSQGERQRVAVCRALLPRPGLVLADEPTGNLDPANTEHVLDMLFGYAEREGATLVTVTHDREVLPRFERSIDFKSFTTAEAAP
jgi:ABC-type lipoprotein export system ATPase subunit